MMVFVSVVASGSGNSTLIIVTALGRFVVGHSCNSGAGIMDDVARLEKRIAFLKAHDKTIDETTRRIALIKAVHQKRLNILFEYK
jgi:hypothetical protein